MRSKGTYITYPVSVSLSIACDRTDDDDDAANEDKK